MKAPTDPTRDAAEPAAADTQRAARRPRRARRTTSGTVMVRIPARMVELAVAEGLNRETLLEAAGLRGMDLTDGDARVPIASQVALWQLLAKRIPDPGFGVRVGASLRPRDAGLLGYVMAYSATLGDALGRLVRYSFVLNDAVECTLERPDRDHVAVVERHPEVGVGLALAADYRMASLVSVCRQITGAEIVPHVVDFDSPRRAPTPEHLRFFRCPLRFGRPRSAVVFLERDLHVPVRQSDEKLAEYLSGYAEQVLRSLVSGSSISERVRSAIWNTLSDGRPTITRIASALRLPPRTLQRRLADEGTSLQREIDEVRKAMATAMLRDRANSIDEVAFLLGYAEPSTLFRAFKRWTGLTPEQFRSAPA